MLGFAAYKAVEVSPRKKQEKLLSKFYGWIESFDQLDSISDKDERANCLHGLLIERRVLLKELKGDTNLQGLMGELERINA